MANNDPPRRSEPPPERLRPEERAVLDALRELSYGTLEVIVHQSKIVQMTRSEKQRFD